MSATPVEQVRRAVRDAMPEGRVLLAVSGGVDSMVLLDSSPAERVAAVATFDHGTGEFARAAVAHVRREAERRGVPVVAAAASLAAAGEGAWREARWRFLRGAAREVGASYVATGHTRDDHVETVAMRVLRDAGPRGLAGLLTGAPDVVRPLLAVDRATVVVYARARRLAWVEDPSNRSYRYRRNRVRHELLPLLRQAAPDLDDALLAVARRAAEWRRDVDALVDATVAVRVVSGGNEGGAIHVATGGLARYDAEELAILWPAIAARGGVRLDRRGTVRLAEFTMRVVAGAPVGAEMQLAGGIDVVAQRGELVLRARRSRCPAAAGSDYMAGLALGDGVRVGGWRFRRIDPDARFAERGAWLPADLPLTVRPWRAGDRMRWGRTARRVKRFFADARVPGRERPGWPVVLAGGEIVWIPGVRRSDAATDRPGRPGVHYLCERIDG